MVFIVMRIELVLSLKPNLLMLLMYVDHILHNIHSNRLKFSNDSLIICKRTRHIQRNKHTRTSKWLNYIVNTASKILTRNQLFFRWIIHCDNENFFLFKLLFERMYLWELDQQCSQGIHVIAAETINECKFTTQFPD